MADVGIPSHPPAYAPPEHSVDGDSPAPTRDFTEHIYTFRRPSGNTIGLNLYSFAPESSGIPFYWAGSNLRGIVTLDLSPPSTGIASGILKENVKSVYVLIRGYKVVSSNKGHANDLGSTSYQRPFLQTKIQLFPEDGSSSGKIESGNHTWPFSTVLPLTFDAQTRNGTTFPLPPTFSRSGLPEFFKYEIQVVVHKGRLRTDEILIEPILLFPRSAPSTPPSTRLMSASQSGTSLPLPTQDAEGWLVKQSTLTAHILNAWAAVILIKLAVPSPGQYARGLSIPFFISTTIQSITSIVSGSSSVLEAPSLETIANVNQALRNAFDVSLEVIYLIGYKAGKGFTIDDSDELPNVSSVKAEPIIQHVTSAHNIWPAAESLHHWGSDEKKVDPSLNDEVISGLGVEGWLQGEILTKANMMPDFVFPSLRLSHTIGLRIHDDAGSVVVLNSEDSVSQDVRKLYGHHSHVKGPPLVSHTVQITTHSHPGGQLPSVAPAPEYQNALESGGDDSE